MAKNSAGILMYRIHKGYLEVLLVHPGGPFWEKKDRGVWSIPKGLISETEEPLTAAKREFEEEIGIRVKGKFIPLQPVKLQSGKILHVWAVEGNCDPSEIKSNTFTVEWPPRSNRIQEFPEVDRASWFNINKAKEKINPGQIPILEQLRQIIEIGTR
jgi:predicted NUDIX family NTP pyrophosphohydrolase